jgi:hypothetical protein
VKPSKKSNIKQAKTMDAAASMLSLKMNMIEKQPQSRFKHVSRLGTWRIMGVGPQN